MQAANKSFKLNIDTNRIIVTLKSKGLKIILINYSQEAMRQQNYVENNLPFTTAKKFVSCAELYSWLERYKDYPQIWQVQNADITVAF